MNFFDFNFNLADFFAKVDTGSLLYASLLLGAIVIMICAVVLAVIMTHYLIGISSIVAQRIRDRIALGPKRYRPANLFFKEGA